MSTSGIILITSNGSPLSDSYLALPEFEASIVHATESGLPLFVVLNKTNDLWESRLSQMGVSWGVCPDSELGIQHCIAYGVHCNQDWDGWVIDVAVPPFTDAEMYMSLGEAAKTFKVATLSPSDTLLGSGRIRSQSFPLAFNASLGFKLLDPASGFAAEFLNSVHRDLPETQARWQKIMVQGTVSGNQSSL